jgi:hypothetical protein
MYNKENLKNCLAPRRAIYIFSSLQVSTNGKPIENITIIEAKTNLLVEKFTPYQFPQLFSPVLLLSTVLLIPGKIIPSGNQ